MENQIEQPNWRPYEGKEVHVEYNRGMVNGVMQPPMLDRGYVDFIPHIVYNPDGTCYLDRKTPRRISINRIFGGDPEFLAFEKEGQLAWIVEETNKNANRTNKHVLGFGSLKDSSTKP